MIVQGVVKRTPGLDFAGKPDVPLEYASERLRLSISGLLFVSDSGRLGRQAGFANPVVLKRSGLSIPSAYAVLEVDHANSCLVGAWQ